jgi:hypothetical protein
MKTLSPDLTTVYQVSAAVPPRCPIDGELDVQIARVVLGRLGAQKSAFK